MVKTANQVGAMAEEAPQDVAALLARIEQQDERIEYLEDMVESLVNTVNVRFCLVWR
jgi:hypothetical protein